MKAPKWLTDEEKVEWHRLMAGDPVKVSEAGLRKKSAFLARQGGSPARELQEVRAEAEAIIAETVKRETDGLPFGGRKTFGGICPFCGVQDHLPARERVECSHCAEAPEVAAINDAAPADAVDISHFRLEDVWIEDDARRAARDSWERSQSARREKQRGLSADERAREDRKELKAMADCGLGCPKCSGPVAIVSYGFHSIACCGDCGWQGPRHRARTKEWIDAVRARK